MPLSRFRIIDLTTVRSGSTCTKVLADEMDLHRNKKSMILDLQRPRGVLERLGYGSGDIRALLAEGVAGAAGGDDP